MVDSLRDGRASRRGIAAATLGLAFGLALGVAGLGSALAQDATPQATPGTVEAVPCTDLFGIEAGNACVLVVHGSPDAGPVDVYLDGELALSALEFGVLNDFVAVPAGEHQVQVTPTGAAPEDAVIDAQLDFEAGIAYEVGAIGPVAEIAALVLSVDTSPLPADTARARIVHASADAGPVDVAVTGGDVLVENAEYPGVTEYLELPADTYDLEVRPTGTEEVALPLPGTLLEADTVYSIYALGSVADGTLGGFIVPVLVSPDIAAAADATPEVSVDSTPVVVAVEAVATDDGAADTTAAVDTAGAAATEGDAANAEEVATPAEGNAEETPEA